jgi:sugar lactone lactonase YvrE
MTTTPLSVGTLIPAAAAVGEGPVWDPVAERLVWVDIPAGLVHTSSLDGTTSTIRTPTMVGAVALRQAGGLVAATREGFAVIGPDGEVESKLDVLRSGHRMNDAKCDSRGRFWAGSTEMSFASGEGALHVLAPNWVVRTVLEDLTLPNGLGWSTDDRTFYLADTVEHVLWAFDCDPDTAALGRRRALRTFDDSEGMPDGLCVDAADRVWLAMWGGSRVLALAPDGTVLLDVAVPVRQPTSCAFAGRELDVLCITSAREGLGLADDDPAPDGSVLSVTGTGARGVSSVPFAG